MYTVHGTLYNLQCLWESVLFHIPSRFGVHLENHGQLNESLSVYQVVTVAATPSLVSHGVPERDPPLKNYFILSPKAQHFMIMTTSRKKFCIFTRISGKIKGAHPCPPIGQPLLSHRAAPTLLEGTIVSLVRVWVAL